MTTNQRWFVLEVPIRVAKLKDQSMRLGYIRRKVTVAGFDSSNVCVSVNDLARDVIDWKVGADQASWNVVNLLPEKRRNQVLL